MDEVRDLGAAAVAVGTNNVDSCVAWVEQLGCSLPVAGDFWPHGMVALQYGVLRAEGVADRAFFVVDRDGCLRWKALYPFDELPPVEPALAALRSLSAPA